jgi:predicted nicotinamide N-methyase
MSDLRIRYQTFEFVDFDIHIRSLRDTQEFYDGLGEAEALGISSAQWSLFGQVWPSSQVLAREVEALPNVEGKRFLEVGCGLALASLVLSARGADVTASDYHPEAAAFLVENLRLNDGCKVPYLRADWNRSYDGLGKFDVIIGSDILYERDRVLTLVEFIERHSQDACEVILVDPGRGNHALFNGHMKGLGFEASEKGIKAAADCDIEFKGKVLRFARI